MLCYPIILFSCNICTVLIFSLFTLLFHLVAFAYITSFATFLFLLPLSPLTLSCTDIFYSKMSISRALKKTTEKTRRLAATHPIFYFTQVPHRSLNSLASILLISVLSLVAFTTVASASVVEWLARLAATPRLRVRNLVSRHTVHAAGHTSLSGCWIKWYL